LQVLDVQLAHTLPVPETDEPSELLENNESTRWALPPQLGHKAAPPAWLIGLSSSNLSSQSEQKYSYIGIIPSL